MKMLFITFMMTFSVAGVAEENLSECTQGLMSQPLCITKINAKSFCKQMGDTLNVVNMVTGCFQKLGSLSQNKQELTALCLAGYKTSKRPEDNKSLCEEAIN